MKKYFVMMAVLLMLLSSCGREADHTVDLWRETEPVFHNPVEKTTVVINKNSMTFHLDADCSSLLRAKEENRMELSVETADALLVYGYKPCGRCATEKESEGNMLP
jgi:hypothetical protein